MPTLLSSDRTARSAGSACFRPLLGFCAALAATFLLCHCAAPGPGSQYQAPPGPLPSTRPSAVPSAPADAEPAVQASRRSAEVRPGLATGWGDAQRSSMHWGSFRRANGSDPWATASFHYDDATGAEALARSLGAPGRTSRSSFGLASGAVEVGLKDRYGRWYPAYLGGERPVVVGRRGAPYRIVLRNGTNVTLEMVVSVDGLDVMDGRPASYGKRGYIVDGGGTLEIAGFRTGMDEVAGFRFSTVGGSYAARRHGDTRNVGVIGVALFHEPGHEPWTGWGRRGRRDAQPFPGGFATPPQPAWGVR